MDSTSMGPSASISPLARARLDEILEELLQRVSGMLDTQERLRGLLDAVVSIASDLSLDRVLEHIVKAASQLADAEYAALGVLGAGPERRLREFVTYGLTDDERDTIGDLPRGKGLLGYIIDHPEPLRLLHLQGHEASFGFPPGHPPMGSFLGTPIRIRDKVFGNLYLTEKRGGGEFTTEDQEIVVALAAAAGVVIENARLYEEGARREAWLSAAAEITAALLGRVNLTDALQLVADRARSVATADMATVLLTGPSGGLTVEVVAGVNPEGAIGQSIELAASLAGTAVETGDMLVIEDASLEANTTHGFIRPSSWPRPGPVILLPLRTADGLEGVLNLIWDAENTAAFRDVDVRLAAAFAEQAALALQVVHAQQDQALLAVFEDRDRIGRDLHDLVIQRLFAVGLNLENTARLVTRPEVASRLGEAVDDLDSTIKDIRRTIFALSVSNESTSLRHELGRLLTQASSALGFEPRLETFGPVDLAVPPRIRPHLIAVVTEALSNTSRHANSTAAVVTLAIDESVTLTIADNGKGFDPSLLSRESGLRNMRERAESLGGACQVQSSPAGGTSLVWKVPVSAELTDEAP